MSLQSAFQATTYSLELPTGRVDIRIGMTHPALDDMVADLEIREWAIVTAHNPSGLAQAQLENGRAQSELAAAAASWVTHPGWNRADAGDWPDEPTLLILGIAECDAAALGRRFGQAAIVVGRIGEPARLLWCFGESKT